MVDSVGSTPLAASGSVTRVVAATAMAAAQPAVQQSAPTPTPAPSAQTQLGNLAKTIAAEVPVDSDRVGEIKKAIQNGSFPILPATIADRLLALRLNWNGHDAA